MKIAVETPNYVAAPASHRKGVPAEESRRDRLGSSAPRARARQHRKSVLVILQDVLLIRTGEAHAFENGTPLLVNGGAKETPNESATSVSQSQHES